MRGQRRHCTQPRDMSSRRLSGRRRHQRRKIAMSKLSDDANDDAGDDRKIKSAVSALDANVAGQTAKPVRPKPLHRTSPSNSDQRYRQSSEIFRLRASTLGSKVAPISERNKVEAQWQSSSEIITRRSAFRKRRGGRDPKRLSQTRAQISSRRRQG